MKLSPEVNDRLEKLVVETGAQNVTEVIRRALEVFDYLHSESRDVVIRDEDGSEQKLLLM